jgi:hypothetical protein
MDLGGKPFLIEQTLRYQIHHFSRSTAGFCTGQATLTFEDGMGSRWRVDVDSKMADEFERWWKKQFTVNLGGAAPPPVLVPVGLFILRPGTEVSLKGGKPYLTSVTVIQEEVRAFTFFSVSSSGPNYVDLRFELKNGHAIIAVEHATAAKFEAWWKNLFSPTPKPLYTSMSATVKEIPPRGKTTGGIVEKATCPECYGTGYHKGFGAPCSKRCCAP